MLIYTEEVSETAVAIHNTDTGITYYLSTVTLGDVTLPVVYMDHPGAKASWPLAGKRMFIGPQAADFWLGLLSSNPWPYSARPEQHLRKLVTTCGLLEPLAHETEEDIPF